MFSKNLPSPGSITILLQVLLTSAGSWRGWWEGGFLNKAQVSETCCPKLLLEGEVGSPHSRWEAL